MRADPTELEIFKNLFHSVAEEMGAALRRSGFSPNIKERRDYSCAVFDGAGRAVAMGDHMPVHLGSMPASVAAAMAAFSESGGLGPGDVAVLNDPFAGGTLREYAAERRRFRTDCNPGRLPDRRNNEPVPAQGSGHR